MKQITSLLMMSLYTALAVAQKPLSPEKLWELDRVGAIGVSTDKQFVLFSVTTPKVAENTFSKSYFKLAINGGVAIPISKEEVEKQTEKRNVQGDKKLIHKSVKIKSVLAPDFYEDLQKSSGQVYTSLDHRHWDKWTDGTYNHVFVEELSSGKQTDIMQDLPYYCPQEPFGSTSDYIWHPNGEKVLYVTKAKTGTAYVQSTNTDIYEFDLDTQTTQNLTEGMMGYDTHPSFSKSGVLAWLSMENEGNEADKNDLIILHNGKAKNITKAWDGTVSDYIWSEDSKKIYFNAPIDGTVQLFEINPFAKKPMPKQLTKGDFDINGLVGQVANRIIVTRTDMNRAAEIYVFNLKNNQLSQLSRVNDQAYKTIAKSKVEKRYIVTSDGKQMLTWVIYPPDFDPKKKYPTLLYCQGGPQSPLSHFYSFRWNFQLMAAQGYIVVAPNRRGMPGHGVDWNAAISGDWGGQAMRDYLTAIDALAQEPFVDNQRLGAIGASYGGYSVFYLAGIHQKRFKTFIAHCGVFNLQSMYGTTEEIFFTNNELGGAYWEENNPIVQKSYTEFNPIHWVNRWDTPILIIHGGKDYRVPKEQGLQAFTAAQLRGIKSELLYFPDENHWVLQPQNGMFWQRNFFRWLKETL
ncbi:S9 family peptidase [Capnocytophaga canimorsus]|uniref:S9 family peptidase n=1 Tax=Capnocytophaga canimorsus TaxID=28188 RepID=A0AAC9Z350_9FLAO|nr:S9 family peptidase [Capnocytophaga canimorsus]ATA92942.1 S9 family peptidase [Capnocytophaga canimorsus]